METVVFLGATLGFLSEGSMVVVILHVLGVVFSKVFAFWIRLLPTTLRTLVTFLAYPSQFKRFFFGESFTLESSSSDTSTKEASEQVD